MQNPFPFQHGVKPEAVISIMFLPHWICPTVSSAATNEISCYRPGNLVRLVSSAAYLYWMTSAGMRSRTVS
ncbi:hypothetical protein RRG08_021053 [Elysia crispata]|uniref:Uncharacterized protein n=1 Tax=Elysia crispata TaxID=231223 RepID=A0AAE0Z025_9GAST|nr:hypothetical protein RRG08_021053 [Elysia crispata]